MKLCLGADHNDIVCLTIGQSIKSSDVAFREIGAVVETGEWSGIPIVKEQDEPGFHNPVTVKDVVNALNYFGMAPQDVHGLEIILITGRSPYTDELNSGWAFGAYQVIWEETRELNPASGRKTPVRRPKQNRLILWAQKLDLIKFQIGMEMRQGYYYRIQPEYQGSKVDRYISVKALRREILGDTVLHEIGHHVDIWQYGRYIENNKDRAKAERYAEAYSAALSKGKTHAPEFEAILMGTYQTPQAPAQPPAQPEPPQPPQPPAQPQQPQAMQQTEVAETEIPKFPKRPEYPTMSAPEEKA